MKIEKLDLLLRELLDKSSELDKVDFEATIERFIGFLSKKIENTRSIEEVFTPLNSVAHSEPIFV